MKEIRGIKLILLGIALISFFPYAERLMSDNQTIFSGFIASFGAFSPLIGLAFCIAGFFSKDKTNKDN